MSPPATEPVKPDAAPDETEAEAEAEDQDKPAEPVSLGPPLGEDVAKLVSLQPNGVVWIDKENRRVIAVGQVCQRNAPLEMFACSAGTKEHEAVVSIPARAMLFHTALLAVGAKPGKPVQFNPKYVPASGTEIAIEVRWKDASGKIRSARAQEWIRNASTKKPMEHNWVFGGSTFWTDERTGHEYYSADGGDLICVSNFPSAMLDLPIESSQKDSDLMFQAFTENIPELGTPVTIILKPKLE
ncbi:MAG TPA: YdjY domain-containing protein [Thermoguttaceae bacterium]|nr:YdjY domain-containing protein [Thermoguttaceae bacterium]